MSEGVRKSQGQEFSMWLGRPGPGCPHVGRGGKGLHCEPTDVIQNITSHIPLYAVHVNIVRNWPNLVMTFNWPSPWTLVSDGRFCIDLRVCKTKEELKFKFWPHDLEGEAKSEDSLPSTVSSTNRQTDKQTNSQAFRQTDRPRNSASYVSSLIVGEED